MHTSYFGNIKNLPRGKTIAICQGIPVWYKGARYLDLAPSWDMVRLRDSKEYERRYDVILKGLDPAKVFKELEGGKGS